MKFICQKQILLIFIEKNLYKQMKKGNIYLVFKLKTQSKWVTFGWGKNLWSEVIIRNVDYLQSDPTML